MSVIRLYCFYNLKEALQLFLWNNMFFWEHSFKNRKMKTWNDTAAIKLKLFAYFIDGNLSKLPSRVQETVDFHSF